MPCILRSIKVRVALMRWKRFLAAITAASLMAWSSLSFAVGELENVTLTVYVNPTGAPQAFMEEDITHPQGVDIDIIYELQRRLLFNLTDNRIFPLPRDDGFERLQAGEADMVVGGISFTQERAKLYDFTPIFFTSSLTVVYSKRLNPEIKDEESLRGLRIGYERGSTSEDYIKLVNGVGVPFDNVTLGLFQVAYGRLDALIYDRPPMEDFVKSVPSVGLAVTEHRFGENACKYAFALRKGSPYNEAIYQTILEMMVDGTIDSILKKWDTAQ